MKKTLSWSKGIEELRPITEDDLIAAEAALGVRFPDDFIGLMVRHQGMSLESAIIRANDYSVPLGRLSYLVESTPLTDNLVGWCLRLRRRGYPSDLIPFSRSGGSPHLALDYASSPPCVVYVYPREIYLKPGDTYTEPVPGSRTNGYWSTVKVADSITDMLERLEPE